MSAISSVNLALAAELLAVYRANNTPVMIWGKPGLGKSEMVAQDIATIRETNPAYGFIDKRIALLQPVDFNGLPVVNHAERVAEWFAPDWLPRIDRDGPEGTLFLDEINAGTVAAMAALYELVLNRRLGAYIMPPGWRIVAAGNRQQDKAAAQKMPSALANRFAHIVVESDVPTWCDWAIRANQPALGVAFMRFRPHLLHIMPGEAVDVDGNGRDMRVLISPDSPVFPTGRQWVESFKYLGAPYHLRKSLIGGLVSAGPAEELEGFIKTFTTLPSMSSILADPSGARVPDQSDPATMFALSCALARQANVKTFGAVMEYAQRLPKEYEILTAHDATTGAPSLKETREYVAFANRNAEIFA